jgi:hypothetical protein
MKIKIAALVLIAMAAFVLRTVGFDAFRSSQLSVEITGPVSVLELPFPAGSPGNRVVGTINRGDTVRVLKTFLTAHCTALKVKAQNGPVGYIIKGDHFTVR